MGSQKTKSQILLWCLPVLLIGCGGSPPVPSPPPSCGGSDMGAQIVSCAGTDTSGSPASQPSHPRQ